MFFDSKKSKLLSISAFPLIFTAVATGSLLGQAADLTPRPHDEMLLRVKTMVEVSGSLAVDPLRTKKAKTIPMEVKGEMFFDQRGLQGDDYPVIRHYWDAKAEFTINDKKSERALRGERQVVLLHGSELRDRFCSPLGPLQRAEIDLIDVAGSAFPPELLLPNKSVQVDDAWSHDDDVVTGLVRIEEVESNDLESTVTDVTDTMVKIRLSGNISGNVDGADTKMELVGSYHFDRETKIVKWLAIAIKEKREIDFAAPGFDVVARIRTARQIVDDSKVLNDTVIADYELKPTVGDRLLDFVSLDELFHMALDRRWHLLSQQPSSAKMRMVDDGDLLATCKIDRLNPTPKGKDLTLEGFQIDVKRALDSKCEEIVSASESVNPQGVRLLRVVAAGTISKAPIRWIYYHLSNKDGKRISVIFTHEASLEERFAGMDHSLISSVQFLDGAEQETEQEVEQQAKSATEDIR